MLPDDLNTALETLETSENRYWSYITRALTVVRLLRRHDKSFHLAEIAPDEMNKPSRKQEVLVHFESDHDHAAARYQLDKTLVISRMQRMCQGSACSAAASAAGTGGSPPYQAVAQLIGNTDSYRERRAASDATNRQTSFALILLDLLFNYRSTYPRLETTRRGQELTGVSNVYLASSQWNSGKLLQEHWVPSLLQLISDLGAANVSVFVSIYENGSWDSTKTVLQQLRQTLESSGVQHSVNIDDTSHEQIIAQNASSSGWLDTAYGKEMRRIPYLASVRNEALKPLYTLSASGAKFDRILYINDVVFSVGFPNHSHGARTELIKCPSEVDRCVDSAQYSQGSLCSSVRSGFPQSALELG
ncbi:MAG: hypothetical protein Q9195_008711 [Heterodermia aff. obscurata]